MPHIHKLIDFTVCAFIVYGDKVLLVDHKKEKMWLPIGGHVELEEDPEEALMREIKEECGLEVQIIGERPAYEAEGVKPLIAPSYLDIHTLSESGSSHRHIGLVYFAKAASDEVTLAAGEHNNIRWFSEAELEDKKFTIRPHVVFYAREALKSARKNRSR